jgi:hypothetical protein
VLSGQKAKAAENLVKAKEANICLLDKKAKATENLDKAANTSVGGGQCFEIREERLSGTGYISSQTLG